MKVRFAILILISFLFFTKESYSQLFPRFSIAGGPTTGWQYQNTDDLNNEMKRIGIPTFPVDGFLTLGGGGFVDLPIKSLNWLRVGGSGTGFNYKRQITNSDNITKTVYYSYGSWGITLEYVRHLGKTFEITGGAYLSTGKLTIDYYQNAPGYGNWNTIFTELSGLITSDNLARKLSVRFYSAQPVIGIGAFITPYMYAKLNAGYMLSVNNEWIVDDEIPVTNAPSGIKADGFNISFGLNFGLFTK